MPYKQRNGCALYYEAVSYTHLSAFLYQPVLQLYKAMYYQLSLVAIQICVIGFISHSLVLLTLSLYL